MKKTKRADDTRVKRCTGLEPNTRLGRQRPKHVGKKMREDGQAKFIAEPKCARSDSSCSVGECLVRKLFGIVSDDISDLPSHFLE